LGVVGRTTSSLWHQPVEGERKGEKVLGRRPMIPFVGNLNKRCCQPPSVRFLIPIGKTPMLGQNLVGPIARCAWGERKEGELPGQGSGHSTPLTPRELGGNEGAFT